MDRQETFDKVARHLLTQGRRSAELNPMVSGGVCRYRSPDGTKCAVGALIPDELYSADMEGRSVIGLVGCDGNDDVSPWAEALRAHLGVESDYDERFLETLQRIHDGYEPDTWPSRLIELADEDVLDKGVLKEFGYAVDE
jgi:hypothetical protein